MPVAKAGKIAINPGCPIELIFLLLEARIHLPTTLFPRRVNQAAKSVGGKEFSHVFTDQGLSPILSQTAREQALNHSS